MGYYTRVLSKLDDYPSFDDLNQFIRSEHPSCKLVIEEGTEDEWDSLLLSTDDDVEIAVLERNPVADGSIGQDEIADFIEDTQDSKPESGVLWLHEFLVEVKTVYAFQHLQGADSVEGSAALHALRSHLWERGESIIQADQEGFTNEDGYHIVWQFSDTVSGPWNMAVLQDGTWHHFKMDLGDPDQREAFLNGEVPPDAATVQLARPGE
ncbi:hypothetical protein [Occallatibacter riparius]|uniref:Uncharacterized protein n=1 Tax=Occallatibacter riparius TaxID=1002689 RepID=A0A9J7BIQ9_9BACT|nr:hypothetical protein [Occallatibacter riparius]UWZ82688.1 hypothetical protein MOP44_19210 [Occallatibacter riparius]